MRRLSMAILGLVAVSLLAGCAGWNRTDDALCPGGSNCPVEE